MRVGLLVVHRRRHWSIPHADLGPRPSGMSTETVFTTQFLTTHVTAVHVSCGYLFVGEDFDFSFSCAIAIVFLTGPESQVSATVWKWCT